MDVPEANFAVPAAPAESRSRTLLVAFVVCLVCSVVVASAAVLLKPIQTANREADRKRNIIEISGLMQQVIDISSLKQQGLTAEQAYARVETRLVELASGAEVDVLDPETFDIARDGKDPALSTPLDRSEDVAQIKRKPKYLPVYRIVGKDGKLQTLILPVYGYGMWSTMYGFLALEGDLRTVQGLRFYQHAETPGLGGEIDNSRWREQWQGKVVFDDQWRVQIALVKGVVDRSAADAQHQIDGLAGASITARGVTNLLNFWLGDEGFAPYLARLRDERSQTP